MQSLTLPAHGVRPTHSRACGILAAQLPAHPAYVWRDSPACVHMVELWYSSEPGCLHTQSGWMQALPGHYKRLPEELGKKLRQLQQGKVKPPSERQRLEGKVRLWPALREHISAAEPGRHRDSASPQDLRRRAGSGEPGLDCWSCPGCR